MSAGYDAKTVQTTFKKSMTTLRACYEKALATDERLTGCHRDIRDRRGRQGIDIDATSVADTVDDPH